MTDDTHRPASGRADAGGGAGADHRAGQVAVRGDGEDGLPVAGRLGLDAAGLWLGRAWTEVPWVVVDVEGNGQRPPDLVEAACLPIDGGVPGRVQSWLVRPPRPIIGPVRRIHGIRNADVATAPTTAEVAEQIRVRLAGRVVIGHHVHVDLAVLGRELSDWSAPAVLDTLRLARRLWPGRPSYSLDNLIISADSDRRPFDPTITGATSLTSALPPTLQARHRAGYDASLTAGLFLALVQTATQTARQAEGDRTGSSTGGVLSAARLLTLAGSLPASRLSE